MISPRTALLASALLVACSSPSQPPDETPDAQPVPPPDAPVDALPEVPDAPPAPTPDAGPDATVDVTAPDVAAFAPADGATDAEPGTEIRVTFSEPMRAASLDGALRVIASDGAVAGTWSYDPAVQVATFVPTRPLSLRGSFRVEVAATATDAAGNPITATRAVFTVRAGRWRDAVDIETKVGEATAPAAAVDGTGHAVVVFGVRTLESGTYANRLTFGRGWSGAQTIGDAATTHRIALAADGTGIATWIEGHDLVHATLSPDGAWTPDAPLEDHVDHVIEAEIGLADTGVAVVAYTYGGMVWTRERVPGVGWTPIDRRDTRRRDDWTLTPKLAVARDGTALLAWKQTRDQVTTFHTAQYVPATGWTDDLDQGRMADATVPRLALDGRGGGILAGLSPHPAFRLLAASRWGVWEAIDFGAGTSLAIRSDAAGNQLALWLRAIGTTYELVWSARAADQPWSRAATLDPTTSSPGEPVLALAPDGTAIAAWTRLETRGMTIWASRYTGGTAWSRPEPIDRVETTNPQRHSLSVAASDRGAVVTWLEQDGQSRDVRAAVFE